MLLFAQLSVLSTLLLLLQGKSWNQCVLVSMPLSHGDLRNCSGTNPQDVTVIHHSSHLKLIVSESELQYSALIRFAADMFSLKLVNASEVICNQVIGVVGDLDFKAAKIIHTLASRSNLNVTQVAAVTSSNFQPFLMDRGDQDIPNVLDMNPLIHYIEALISFTDSLNWTRIGLISDDTHYHQFAAELLQIQLKDDLRRTVVPYIRLHKGNVFHRALQVTQEYGTHIMIISMDKVAACLLLEEAQKMGLTWPDYAWIILDSESSLSFDVSCHHNGVITVKDYSIKEQNTDMSHVTHCSGNRSEIFSSVILDSVEVIALAHRGTKISFEGLTGLVKFRNGNRLNNISIVQAINGSRKEIARYNSESQQLMLISEFDVGPRGSILVVYNQSTVLHSVLVVTMTFLCFVLVTVTLILYVFFRKEKEIKATSVTVSMSMFLGCYLMLLYIPLLLVKSYPQSKVAVPQRITCNFLAWLRFANIPLSLILATMFVKMLRVYAIFQDPFSIRKKLFKDYFLLLYIVILISPNVLILTCWSAFDPIFIKEVFVPNRNHLLILEYCAHTHRVLLLVLPLVFESILCVAVVVVAIKSSKIRHKHFQDAKATNAFVFVAITVSTMGTFYYYFFFFVTREESAGNYVSAEITLNLSILILVGSCQIFLFLPKVYTPMRRFLSQKR